jgi:hypothetical protein
MDTWRAGFKSKTEVFTWVGTSRFFNPRTFRSKGEGFRKVKLERKMYYEFVEWATEKVAAAKLAGEGETPKRRSSDAGGEALDYFGKRDLFEGRTRERKKRLDLKEVWTGSRVRDWTDLGNHWRGVKIIMDEVRARHGGDEGVWQVYDREGEEGVKRIVLQVANGELKGALAKKPPVEGVDEDLKKLAL